MSGPDSRLNQYESEDQGDQLHRVHNYQSPLVTYLWEEKPHNTWEQCTSHCASTRGKSHFERPSCSKASRQNCHDGAKNEALTQPDHDTLRHKVLPVFLAHRSEDESKKLRDDTNAKNPTDIVAIDEATCEGANEKQEKSANRSNP